MRYRFAALSLAAVLGVLPGLTTIPAAPAPAKAKQPAVYALVYVGLGRNDQSKNDLNNAERTTVAISSLRTTGVHAALGDPKVDALPIIRDQKRRLGGRELVKWAKSKTRIASLEGTAVLRVWFTEGSPEEQVLIVNTIVRDYVQFHQRCCRDALKADEIHESRFKAMKEREGAKVTEKEERVFRRREEAFKHPSHVLEWASLPDKP